MDPKRWAEVEVARLAEMHFAGRTLPLQRIVVNLARRHESVWRELEQGVFRPTPSMYAVALRWELGKRGATCGICPVFHASYGLGR